MNKFESERVAFKVVSNDSLFWFQRLDGLIPSYLMFKGKDGKDYATFEALQDANQRWFERMFRPKTPKLVYSQKSSAYWYN